MTATELTIYDLPVKPSADPGRTPALIGREVDTILKRTRQTMTIASIAIGYRFIEVKEMEGYGGWLPWLAARGINDKAANRAMGLATHHQHLTHTEPEKVPDFVTTSYTQALEVVKKSRRERGLAPRPRQQRQLSAPQSLLDLERQSQQVPGAPPPVKVGDEQIDPADLGPGARQQIERATAAPETKPEPVSTSEPTVAETQAAYIAALRRALPDLPPEVIAEDKLAEPRLTFARARALIAMISSIGWPRINPDAVRRAEPVHSLTGAAARRFGGSDVKCAACGEVAEEHVTVERKDYHPQCLVEPGGSVTPPAPELATAPETPQDDLAALRQRFRDRLAERGMGSIGLVASAEQIGVNYKTLLRFRDGGTVRTPTVKKIAAWLG